MHHIHYIMVTIQTLNPYIRCWKKKKSCQPKILKVVAITVTGKKLSKNSHVKQTTEQKSVCGVAQQMCPSKEKKIAKNVSSSENIKAVEFKCLFFCTNSLHWCTAQEFKRKKCPSTNTVQSPRKPLDYLQRASQQLRTLFVPLSVKVIYIKTNHPNVKNQFHHGI